MSISKFVPLVSLLAAYFKGIPGAIFNTSCEILAPGLQRSDECYSRVMMQSAADPSYPKHARQCTRNWPETLSLGLQNHRIGITA